MSDTPEMIKRVARAIRDAMQRDDDAWPREASERYARAAIEAMRGHAEPDLLKAARPFADLSKWMKDDGSTWKDASDPTHPLSICKGVTFTQFKELAAAVEAVDSAALEGK